MTPQGDYQNKAKQLHCICACVKLSLSSLGIRCVIYDQTTLEKKNSETVICLAYLAKGTECNACKAMQANRYVDYRIYGLYVN